MRYVCLRDTGRQQTHVQSLLNICEVNYGASQSPSKLQAHMQSHHPCIVAVEREKAVAAAVQRKIINLFSNSRSSTFLESYSERVGEAFQPISSYEAESFRKMISTVSRRALALSSGIKGN